MSFVSLGVRAGLVVACSIPLVLAMVFVFMEYSGITMQRISLGALIIALGLLVDDAMITVEVMVTRLEMGESKEQAATFAYTSTAFPMLTGTLVTVAGFVPIGLNASSAGEYTYTLFAVIAVALLVSWVVAVFFAPVLGVHILSSSKLKAHEAEPGRVGRAFEHSLLWCMRHRWLTIIGTVLLFVLALICERFVQNQFFPSSDRPEILVDLNLPQNASIEETRKVVDRFEARIKDDPDLVRWSTYIGQGRFASTYRWMRNCRTLLRAAGNRQQGLRRAPGHDEAPGEDPARRVRGHRYQRPVAGNGPAGGTSDPVPGQWQGHRPGAQACDRACHPARRQRAHRRDDLRLERAR